MTVIDYGMGNVGSIISMARKIGASAVLTDDPEKLRAAQRLVLPGVGAFDHGVQQLKAKGIFDVVREKALSGTPLLGVCLGMQLLVRGSDEGSETGLSLIDATCRRFALPADSGLRVPHVGWNELRVLTDNPLLPREERELRFYFTHSYHVTCNREEDVIAVADYGAAFPAVIGHDNIYGVQFHPEKSHRFGMALFRRFVEIAA